MGDLPWPACLRRLDRELPGYDAYARPHYFGSGLVATFR